MTDKEKLEKVKVEIKRRYDKIIALPIGKDEQWEAIMGAKVATLHSLLSFIDSMQKEPKECMYSKDNYTDEDRKALCEGCEEKCKFNKKEEPASEDLEAAIDTYLATYFNGEKEKQDWPFLKKMTIHFANWQKQQLMAKAVDGFVIEDIEEGNGDFLLSAEYLSKDIGLKDRQKVKVIVIKEN